MLAAQLARPAPVGTWLACERRCKSAQKREQIGPRLNLVQHDQSGEGAQHKSRIGQASLIVRVFQVEMPYRALPLSGQLSCQRSLANLPRAKHGHNREAGQPAGELIEMGWTRDHGAKMVS